jgi:hypothetical protein
MSEGVNRTRDEAGPALAADVAPPGTIANSLMTGPPDLAIRFLP